MSNKILIKSHQLMNINNIYVKDVRKYFTEFSEILIVIENSKIVGIISRESYELLHQYSDEDKINDIIINKKYQYLLENEIDPLTIDSIFNTEKDQDYYIIINDNKFPQYLIYRSPYKYEQSFYCKKLLENYYNPPIIYQDLNISYFNWKKKNCILCNSKDSLTESNISLKKLKSIKENFNNGCLFSNQCIKCNELLLTVEENKQDNIDDNIIPKQIMIKNNYKDDDQQPGIFHISLKNFEEIISKLPDGIESIIFTDEECFLDDNIDKKTEMISQKFPNIKIIANTTGMLSKEKYIIETVMRMNFIKFYLSGINNEMIKKYQSNGCFDNIYNNINYLIQEKKKLNITSPSFSWHVILFEELLSDQILEELFEKAILISVDNIKFISSINNETDYENIKSFIENSNIIKHYQEICNSHGTIYPEYIDIAFDIGGIKL